MIVIVSCNQCYIDISVYIRVDANDAYSDIFELRASALFSPYINNNYIKQEFAKHVLQTLV